MESGEKRVAALSGVAVGFVLATAVFSVGLYALRSEHLLCDSCHEMREAHQSFSASVHGSQKQGVVPECTRCHELSAFEAGKNLALHLLPGLRGEEEEHEVKVPDRACTSCHSRLLSRSMSPEARVEHYMYLKGLRSSCLECHDEEGLFHRETSDREED